MLVPDVDFGIYSLVYLEVRVRIWRFFIFIFIFLRVEGRYGREGCNLISVLLGIW